MEVGVQTEGGTAEPPPSLMRLPDSLLWVGRGCPISLRCEWGGWEGEAQGNLRAGFLREGGVVKGAKDWGPEGSTPGWGEGSLDRPGECPGPLLSSTSCPSGPEDKVPRLQASGPPVGWTCLSRMRTPCPEPLGGRGRGKGNQRGLT